MWFSCLAMLNVRSCCDSILPTTRSCDCDCLAKDMSLSRLRYAAEKELKKLLESTSGVAAIKVIGGLEEQIRIEIDEKKLAELGIPISEITRILEQENLNQASGSLYDLDANYLVRILSQFRSVEEIRNIIVRNQGGRRIVLSDVASVYRGTKDREVIARLNGKESVELAIYKEADANTVTVSGGCPAKTRFAEKSKPDAEGRRLPDRLQSGRVHQDGHR